MNEPFKPVAVNGAKAANLAKGTAELAPLAALAQKGCAEKTARIQRGRPFQPGQSGNPSGRPRGVRNRLSELLLLVASEDFNAHGPEALAQLRQKDPDAYLKLILALVPREAILQLEAEPTIDYADLTDEEISLLLSKQRKRRMIEGALKAV